MLEVMVPWAVRSGWTFACGVVGDQCLWGSERSELGEGEVGCGPWHDLSPARAMDSG